MQRPLGGVFRGSCILTSNGLRTPCGVHPGLLPGTKFLLHCRIFFRLQYSFSFFPSSVCDVTPRNLLHYFSPANAWQQYAETGNNMATIALRIKINLKDNLHQQTNKTISSLNLSLNYEWIRRLQSRPVHCS